VNFRNEIHLNPVGTSEGSKICPWANCEIAGIQKMRKKIPKLEKMEKLQVIGLRAVNSVIDFMHLVLDFRK
jgi:hypothetical protein